MAAASPAIAAGLPRSGSTWCANAALLCLRDRAGGDAAALIYADEVTDAIAARLEAGAPTVIKTHFPSGALHGLARGGAPTLVSLRSPHDCAVSLVERFGYAPIDAVAAVTQSARWLMPLLAAPGTVVLRYEGDVAGGGTGLARIAAALGSGRDEARLAEWRRNLAPAAVRGHIAALVASGALAGRSARDDIDPETGWHFDHLGDGAVGGGVARLAPATLAALDHALRGELPALGYAPAGPAGTVAPGRLVHFSFDGDGAACLGDGFDLVEDWGVWAIGAEASLRLRLAAPATGPLALALTLRLPPALTATAGATCRIEVNGTEVLALHGGPGAGEYARVAVPVPPSAGAAVAVRFVLGGVRSPADLDMAADARSLGIGLVSAVLRPEPAA